MVILSIEYTEDDIPLVPQTSVDLFYDSSSKNGHTTSEVSIIRTR